MRDIADVAAVEVITTAAVHLMSAAAVKCGLAEDDADGAGARHRDLDEAQVQALHDERDRMDQTHGTRPHAVNAPGDD